MGIKKKTETVPTPEEVITPEQTPLVEVAPAVPQVKVQKYTCKSNIRHNGELLKSGQPFPEASDKVISELLQSGSIE